MKRNYIYSIAISCYSQLQVSAQEDRHQALYENMKSKIGFYTIMPGENVEFVIVILKRWHVLINVDNE